MVTPAAADHILITGPSNASAGTPFDIVVTIQDQYGNTVTGYTGTVTFSSDDPEAILPDDYTFTADKVAEVARLPVLRCATLGSLATSATDC